MPAEYDISPATTDDVPGVLALQEPNLPANGGSLSVRHPAESFMRAIGERSLVVCRRDGEIVGYVMGAPLAAKANVSIIQSMLRAFPPLPDCYVYGPVCVAQSERGNGVAGAMFRLLQEHMNRPAVTFVRADNTVSRQAHRKMNMRELGPFIHDGITYIALSHAASATTHGTRQTGGHVTMPIPSGVVVAVSRSPAHRFSKDVQTRVRLLQGLGVDGDAHLGVTVKHRSRVAKDPSQPNLRQVHLVHQELLDELNAAGFCIDPGAIGENILTQGIELLKLPRATRLHLGDKAVVEVTGLRNPCRQLNAYRAGLMAAVLYRDETGRLMPKAGIMGIVLSEGEVGAGDTIGIELPRLPHESLDLV